MAIHSFRGQAPRLGRRVFIDSQACVLGDVELGEDTSIWPGAVVRGDMHRIRIGKRTSVQDGAVLHITHASDYNPQGWPLIIGDDVTIGHQACLHGCRVGSEVLVGVGATLLDGVVVEDQVMIGAGSLVPPGKRLESGYLYVGSPARRKRELTDGEKSYFKYSAANYTKLKDEYLAEGLGDTLVK